MKAAGFFRRLLSRRPVQARALLATAATLSWYAEAQLAGWVEVPHEAASTAAPALEKHGADLDLPARFYGSQQC